MLYCLSQKLAVKLFNQLGMFPQGAHIPITALHALWSDHSALGEQIDDCNLRRNCVNNARVIFVLTYLFIYYCVLFFQGCAFAG